jgi:hypothetical protein
VPPHSASGPGTSPQRGELPVRDDTYTAFSADRSIATGTLEEVAMGAWTLVQADPEAPLVVLSDETGQVVDLDLRGEGPEVRMRYARKAAESESAAAPPRRGRPSLGVVAREVTLLPRHWDWLARQPGGASVTLRKLVEEARRGNMRVDRVRLAREASYRALSVLAGDLPRYEEALRALFAGDGSRFSETTESWPEDIRAHARRMAAAAFA